MSGSYIAFKLTPPLKNKTRREQVTVQGSIAELPTENFPTAQTGIPIPYILGRQRVAVPNCIWYGNLQPITEEVSTKSVTSTPIYDKQPKAEGGGIYWADVVIGFEEVETTKTVINTVGYSIDMAMGICLGPDVHLRAVYADNALIWSGDVGPLGTDITLGGATFAGKSARFYGGNYDQAADATMTANTAFTQPGYVGLAYILLRGVRVDEGFGKLSFEVERFPNPLSLTSGVNRIANDINPITALVDIVTNPWGGAGLPEGLFSTASLTTAATRLAAETNMMAIFSASESAVLDVVRVIQDQTLGSVIYNPETSLIDFRLIRADLIDFDTALRLNPTNIIAFREYNKSAWSQALNQVRVIYTDRTANYAASPVVAQNLAAISSTGRGKRSLTIDFPAVMNGLLASFLADRELVRNSIPRFASSIETNRAATHLLPGDPVVIDWPDYGITGLRAVVSTRSTQPTANGNVTLTFQQIDFPAANSLFVAPLPSLAENVGSAPVSPPAAIFTEAPFWLARQAVNAGPLTAKSGFVMAFPQRADNAQYFFSAFIDNFPDFANQATAEARRVQVLPGTAFANRNPPANAQGEGAAKAQYPAFGTLGAAITKEASWTTGLLTSLTVNGLAPSFPLVSPGLAGARAGRAFLLIDGEYFTYETVTNAGAGVYVFGNVYRGLLDTVAQAHSAGASVIVFPGGKDYTTKVASQVPAGFSPVWRFFSHTITKSGDVDSATIVTGLPTIVGRHALPLRPHNARIAVAGRQTAPGPSIPRGASYNYLWNPRSRNTLNVSFQQDAAEALEAGNGATPDYRLILTDSSSVDWVLATVTGADVTADNVNAAIPMGAALGAATFYVEAVNSVGASLFKDRVPLVVT